MTKYRLKPSRLKGEVTVPPSKSMAHRAVICASLAPGRSRISNIQLSDDIQATIEGMRAFGAVILQEDSVLTIDGVGRRTSSKRSETIDCNESGSTLRFLVPLATLFEGPMHFIGRGKLGQRPLDTYEEIFTEQHLRYETGNSELLDLTIEGSLKAGDYHMRGDISSQFITGMLMTLPLLDGDSRIQLTTELESRGYIDLTLSVLEEFGICIHVSNDYKQFDIKGDQVYQNKDYIVEGDYSQAAFWLGANALGHDLVINGLNEHSLQGDREVLPILEILKKNVTEKEERIIDGSQVPDIIPVVSLVAALSEGKTQITNLERLRIKESDRLTATQKELKTLGADIRAIDDSLHITGVSMLKGGASVWSHKDHRMAMMIAIASTVCETEIELKDPECVSKSYPNFWEEFERLSQAE